MSMCRVFSCVVGRGCLLWPVRSLGKTLLAFGLLHYIFQGQICLYSRCVLTSYFCIPVPYKVVKQEMARVNVDILGISKLIWTGMGEFNLDDHYICYCGQESFRRSGVAIMVNKRVRNAVLGCNLKNNRMMSVHFQGKPLNITVILSLCPNQ